MRALEAEVVDTVWAASNRCSGAFETHPLRCHRPRASDRVCFQAMAHPLGTGCSWVDAEQLIGKATSDTT